MKTITHYGRRYDVVSINPTDVVVSIPTHRIHGMHSRMPIPFAALSPRQRKLVARVLEQQQRDAARAAMNRTNEGTTL